MPGLDGGDHQQQRSSSTNNVDTLGSSRRTSEAGSDPVTELDDMPEVRNIRSASYMKHKRSTSSLSSLFRRRRWRKRRGSISASFSINDNDIKVELLNVNTATEEELMTLPGVNRTLARNIINHRQAIGGFRKVEDLALVSGMGATKLDFIRPEICISRRKPLSRASSKSPSIESIPSTIESTTVSRSRPMKFINVNTATIFDLMQVSGINQALAARIINYRERKGPFKSVDELKNVGISYKRLGAIRMYFTTEDMDLEKLPARTAVSPVSRSHSHLSTHSHGKLSVKSAYANLENESNDLNGNSSGVTHSSQIQDLRAIYELMSVKTVRPKRTSQFNFTSNCLPAYRVTTWNLECLTPAKIGNPGVLEVITRTILENGFSLLAVQEVCDKKALDKICRELNEPVLPKNREWRGYRGVWKSALHSSTLNYKNETHHLGVLYNSEHIDEVTKVDSEAFSPFQNGNLWQFAVFKVKAKHSTWILINVLSASLESSGSASNGHVQSPSNHKDVMEAINSLVKETDGALIMGYFNAQHAQKGLGNLEDLERIYPSSLKDNKNPGPCSVWITSDLKGFLTGDSGSVQEGLNHIAIPDGWGWNGKATSSGPLWCTLYNVPNTVFNPDLINSTEEKPIEKGNNNNNCESVIKAGPHREIKSVDELKNVGISYKRLGAIRMYFTTEDMDLEKLPARTAVSPVSRSHSHLSTHSHGKLSVKSAYANLENESNDLNGNSSGVTHSSQIQDLRAIYELMSVKTVRPKRTSQFNFTSNCLPAYRVTTWNLECLTPAKIGNPGVLEVITRTILENGFSLLAVQEVCDKKALDKICRELNEPVLPKNREWRGYRGVWKSALHSSTLNYKNETHHLGVLYNSEHIDEVTKVDSEAFSPFQNGNLWQFAVFKVKAKHSTWILINVLSASLESSGSASNGHVQSPSNHKDVMEAINSLVKETDGALIMGYFNAQHAQKGLGNLEDLERIYPSSLKDNKNPGPCSVWITSDLKGFLTGDSGSVQEGLNHIAIPDGWGWNGKATSSGPLWCTLYNVPNTVFNPDLINSTEEKPIEKGNNNNNCESVIKAGPHREIKVDSRS